MAWGPFPSTISAMRSWAQHALLLTQVKFNEKTSKQGQITISVVKWAEMSRRFFRIMINLGWVSTKTITAEAKTQFNEWMFHVFCVTVRCSIVSGTHHNPRTNKGILIDRTAKKRVKVVQSIVRLAVVIEIPSENFHIWYGYCWVHSVMIGNNQIETTHLCGDEESITSQCRWLVWLRSKDRSRDLVPVSLGWWIYQTKMLKMVQWIQGGCFRIHQTWNWRINSGCCC